MGDAGWYYVDSAGTTVGPEDKNKLKQLFSSNKISLETYVWNGADVNEWLQLSALPTSHKLRTFLSGGGGPPGRGPPRGPPAAAAAAPKAPVVVVVHLLLMRHPSRVAPSPTSTNSHKNYAKLRSGSCAPFRRFSSEQSRGVSAGGVWIRTSLC
eukprot:98202_1